MTDNQLIDLFTVRSENAVPALAAQYGPYCRAVASRLLSDPRDVDECLNDSFLAVWRAIPPAQPEHFKGWLAAIVRLRPGERHGSGVIRRRRAPPSRRTGVLVCT